MLTNRLQSFSKRNKPNTNSALFLTEWETTLPDMKTKHAFGKVKFKLFEGIVGCARVRADNDICWFVSGLATSDFLEKI